MKHKPWLVVPMDSVKVLFDYESREIEIGFNDLGSLDEAIAKLQELRAVCLENSPNAQ